MRVSVSAVMPDARAGRKSKGQEKEDAVGEMETKTIPFVGKEKTNSRRQIEHRWGGDSALGSTKDGRQGITQTLEIAKTREIL